MHQKLQNIKNEALAMIMDASDHAELEDLRIRYLGKSGQLAELSKEFKDLDPDQRRDIGLLFNDVKSAIESTLTDKLDNCATGKLDNW